MLQILAVEDSPTQAREIQFLLEDAGFMVETATDGLEALKAMRRSTPDLVLTDLLMPHMDGLALIDAVRQDYPFVPVVLITSFGSEAIAARALRDGASSYVPRRNLVCDLVPTLTEILAVSGQQLECRRALECLTRSESEYLLDNDVARATALVQHFENQLAALDLCVPARLIQVGVALREALVNAIEHGNLELGSAPGCEDKRSFPALADCRRRESPFRERRVHIAARASHPEAVFVVRDEGPGFDVSGVLRDPADPARAGRPSGRGLVLIRTFMDEVSFNTAGNQITLVKRREGRPE